MTSVGTIIITGTSRGLGAALCDALLRRSWHVIALTRNELPGMLVGRAHLETIKVDLATDAAEDIIRSHLASINRPVDVIINNAGVPGKAFSFDDVEPDEIARLLNIHLLGAIRATRGALAYLRRADSATIINVSSRLGSLANVASGLYSDLVVSYSYRIAKAAQNMLSLSMANDPTMADMRVLAVHPGQIRTLASSSDAVMAPSDAAERFAQFIDRRSDFASGSFCDTNGNILLW